MTRHINQTNPRRQAVPQSSPRARLRTPRESEVMPCSKNPILSPEPHRIQPRRAGNRRHAGDHPGNGQEIGAFRLRNRQKAHRLERSFNAQQSEMTLRFGRPATDSRERREEERSGGGIFAPGLRGRRFLFSLVRGEACRPAARRGFNTSGAVVGFSVEVKRGPRHGEVIRSSSSATAWRPRDGVTGIGESGEEPGAVTGLVTRARGRWPIFLLFCAPNPFS
jgi:hypothetical protein